MQILSLFEANPSLVDLIIDIAATSPTLALYLSRNSAVLDAVIGGTFFAAWPGRAGLTADLAKRLEVARDYEARLDDARRWMKEWHFRIGVHHLRGLIDGFEAAKQYSDLAEAVIAALWPVVLNDFARKHGQAPGRGAVVLGMGSLGAGRLNAGSDLDLIMIYDAAGIETSSGPRALATRPYYARLTQAMVTALSAQTAEGRLYEVDIRLRPSGRKGPVATSIESFRSYQLTEAWTWEHLALTRARVLAGDPGLGDEVETFRREVLAQKGTAPDVRANVAEMRARLAAAKPGQGGWEAKLGPGRLMDIELLAQLMALITANPARGVERQIAAGANAGILSQTEQTALLSAYRVFWRLQAASRLLSETTLRPDEIGEGAKALLLRETAADSVAGLSESIENQSAAAAKIIETILAG